MTSDPEQELVNRTSDYVAVASKAVLGAVPFVGSLLAEVAGTIIPDQRIDRIAKFAAVLDLKLAHLEHSFIRAQLGDENFTDVLEEGIRQAARSTTEERRGYIASVIARGLSDENIEFIETKHLLRILGELNDIEILWLRFYRNPVIDSDADFRQRHQNVLAPIYCGINSPPEVLAKAALQESYMDHLLRLGLVEPQYKVDFETRQPVFDSVTGKPEVRYYLISGLGDLLLSHLGFD